MPKDLFSTQSDAYARYRPVYPAELFAFLLTLAPGREAAWDCATGNGQAAVVLADHFQTVEATDISEAQLAKAGQKQKIRYSVAAAEQTSFPEHSFDLITVAQAYHWIDPEAFAREARRVGRPGAPVAVWMYNRFSTGAPALDALFDRFYFEITGPYWDPERAHVDDNYSSIAFPFANAGTAEFSIDTRWTRDEAVGYLSTWSAVQKYTRLKGFSPLGLVLDELRAAWPDGVIHPIRFPVVMRYGSV
ncbi:MAG: SAM-dependent methyltransferase [Flaviaesturariibacter sp.]|nr:SAM-dependent methyltransferase [Flaviaesturariibacter sp.]